MQTYGFVYSSKVLGIQVSVQQRSSFHTFPAAVRSPLHVDIESLECESGWEVVKVTEWKVVLLVGFNPFEKY